MQRPYDVLFWMVGQECMKKKIEKIKKNTKKMRKRKVEKTYGLPSRFILCLFYVFVFVISFLA
jgi:cytoskeletal protein RodZ